VFKNEQPDCRDVHIVIARNNGCIPDLPDPVSIEVPCLVGSHGIRPLHVGRLPEAIRALVQTVKAYEEYAVEAGVTGSRETALKALLTHSLVPSYSVAKAMLEELLEANKACLPQFFPADIEAVRQIALWSKMAGADIPHIGDADYSGMANPENILAFSVAIRGRRCTYRRMAASIQR
jgi:hypothetical protein